MKKCFTTYCPIISLVLIFWGCETDGCFSKKSTAEIQYYSTGYFHEINIAGIFDVLLVQDTVCYVEIEAGSEFQKHLGAVVNDSVLRLENSNSCFYTRNYSHPKARVHFVGKQLVDITNVCKVRSEKAISNILTMRVTAEMAEIDIELDNERFSFYNHKSTGGDFSFRGTSEVAYISAYYTAKFSLHDLYVKDLRINNSSIGDMWVNGTEKLEVEIHNRGNIYYTGEPEIFIYDISGSGELIPFENVN